MSKSKNWTNPSFQFGINLDGLLIRYGHDDKTSDRTARCGAPFCTTNCGDAALSQIPPPGTAKTRAAHLQRRNCAPLAAPGRAGYCARLGPFKRCSNFRLDSSYFGGIALVFFVICKCLINSCNKIHNYGYPIRNYSDHLFRSDHTVHGHIYR